MEVGEFLKQVVEVVSSFGGGSWLLRVAGIITVLIASMKVSVLNQYVWEKFDGFKAWAAPILAVVGGVLSMAVSGTPITLASVFAYLSAGAGAIALHELLDTIKSIPGLGSIYVGIIDAIEGVLGSNKSEKVEQLNA